MTPKLEIIYERLRNHFGPQPPPEADTPLEALVGTILAHGANGKNVERVIENLRDADALEFDRLRALDDEELADVLRPVGNVRVNVRRLRNLLAYIHEQHGGSLSAMFATDPHDLRAALLGIRGIGPETADSILLYAGRRPVFVVDAATHRVLARHGWIDFEADYHAIQDFFHAGLPADVRLFGEFHALLALVGKQYCRKAPQCDRCPLAELLPEGGPLEGSY